MPAFEDFRVNYFKRFIQEPNRELVITFFIVFSRFEYALKSEGFFINNHDNVSANWDSFASSIRDQFDAKKTPELLEAVNYLHNSPPRKQVVKEDNQFGWSLRRNDENLPLIHELLLSIRTVRNNLFHGSKFQEISDGGENRNTQLLINSLIILDECLDLSTQVNSRFYLGM